MFILDKVIFVKWSEEEKQEDFIEEEYTNEIFLDFISLTYQDPFAKDPFAQDPFAPKIQLWIEDGLEWIKQFNGWIQTYNPSIWNLGDIVNEFHTDEITTRLILDQSNVLKLRFENRSMMLDVWFPSTADLDKFLAKLNEAKELR